MYLALAGDGEHLTRKVYSNFETDDIDGVPYEGIVPSSESVDTSV
jgi:hypothetical protein